MSKVLFISNLSDKISSFATASIAAANNLGVEFYHASNWEEAKEGQIQADEAAYNIKINSIPVARNPFARQNLVAYKELVALIQRENIDYIHCNTPVGGLLGRLAGKKCKVKRVIYQVHGFHFYKGAPKKNWLLYYPVERWLARYTDALIAINQEDYQLAKKKLKLRNNGKVYYVPGVGIDIKQYHTEDTNCEEKRKELNIPPDAFVLLSAGELNANKNNAVIISAMEQLKRDDLHYVLCGVGDQENSLRMQAEKAGLQNNVHFLGYRNDIKELYKMADCFVMPSLREGLSRSLMEAMASGLPCVASKIRGNTDLIAEAEGGYLCETMDAAAYAEKLNCLAHNPELREKMGKNNLTAIRNFGVETVTEEIRKIYAAEFAE